MTTSLGKMKLGRRDLTVALASAGFGAAMFGLAYASVPLYDLFCRVTRFRWPDHGGPESSQDHH